MIRQLLDNLTTTLYVQIWENRIKITNPKNSVIIEEKPLLECETRPNGKIVTKAIGNNAAPGSINPFSHPRTLFSDFHVGEKVLQELIKKALSGSFLTPSPFIVIHPMEKLNGGLTKIEARAFRELAIGAGGRAAVVYTGAQLLPEQIDFNKLSNENETW